jgi:outer membrane protein, heavy metal efflux system
MCRSVPAAALAVCSLLTASVHAQPAPGLTLDRALELMRAGPAAQALRLRADEARGQLVGARRLGDNPSLTGALGPRLGAAGESRRIEGAVDLMVPLDLAGQRGARVRGAEAALAAEQAGAEAALRRAEAELALAFFRTLAGGQRERVAAAAEADARQAADALARRHQLRDVALLDVNIGRGVLARATALRESARADRLGGEAELQRLLAGAPASDDGRPLALAADLRDQRRFSLPALLARAQDRADVRALLAEAQEARAEVDLGRAARWPRVALGASYERDEGADVVRGVLNLELPLFERGQGLRAAGAARARRLALEAEVARRGAVINVRGAHAAHQARLAAAQTLEQALPLMDQNDELARKGYQAGELSLAAWMLVRREALDTRLEYLDRLLEAAEAGVALAAAAGVSP